MERLEIDTEQGIIIPDAATHAQSEMLFRLTSSSFFSGGGMMGIYMYALSMELYDK